MSNTTQKVRVLSVGRTGKARTALLFWLLGIPIPIIILIFLFKSCVT